MRCLDLQMWISKYKLLQLITLDILAKILGSNRLNQRYNLYLKGICILQVVYVTFFIVVFRGIGITDWFLDIYLSKILDEYIYICDLIPKMSDL